MRLELFGVSKRFGGLRALTDVSFTVRERAIFGLIGPNGAGKTTVFNLITGVYAPDTGTLRFGDRDLSRLSPSLIARSGVVRTFQNVRLFGQLTVLENLLVAGEPARAASVAAALLRGERHRADEAATRARATALIGRFRLQAHANAPATSLSYGHQRRLEIARALMAQPKLLLLDEPAAGMSSTEAVALAAQIRELRDELSIAVLLVEHNMRLVMDVCDELHVLDHGETIARGAPSVVRAHPRVIAAYLGEDAEGA